MCIAFSLMLLIFNQKKMFSLLTVSANRIYPKYLNTSASFHIITKTRLFEYTKILPPKNENFQLKISDIFHISAQNIDCGYSLEPPRRGGSNEYPQSLL